ncbi:MAG: hydrocarbon-binding protein [Alphaproteobacteria bacterium]|nr:hydrocarbon-binding protein [Alphaproteobacteria bacterium]MCB9793823.1 hydrocarbon-binding protein [Alphaproteobacteria bacterium]
MNKQNDARLRPELGDFSSIVCFRAVVVGMEDALGEKAAAVALKAAGRTRGKDLVNELGLNGAGTTKSLDEVQQALDNALGLNGTRLCFISKIEADGEDILVYTRETICSSDEPQGSPRLCTYTLGAVHGAIEAVMDARYRGKQVGSVLRGQDHDIFRFMPR